jgi:hypothetical protein
LVQKQVKISDMGYRYAAPFDMVLQHTAICLGIIITVGFVLTKFFDVLMAAPLSQANQDAGYLGGILSMSVVFFRQYALSPGCPEKWLHRPTIGQPYRS